MMRKKTMKMVRKTEITIKMQSLVANNKTKVILISKIFKAMLTMSMSTTSSIMKIIK
jgi:hypothetical protein